MMTDSNQTPAEQQPEGEAAPQKIKAMRRQPCPCGSGKVFKNCHEGDPAYEVATDADSAVAAPNKVAEAGPKGPAFHQVAQQAKKFNAPARNTGNNHRRKV